MIIVPAGQPEGFGFQGSGQNKKYCIIAHHWNHHRTQGVAGDRFQAGTPVLAIASGNRLVAQLGLEPEDLRALKPGLPVKIRSIFIPEYKAESQLGQVHAMINPATHLVDTMVPIPADRSDQLVLGSPSPLHPYLVPVPCSSRRVDCV